MTRPSWQDFATHDESAYPELWDGVVGAWCPSLGPTGLKLHDHSRYNNWGTLTNMDAATDWVVSGGQYGLDYDGTNDWVSVPRQAAFGSTQWRTLSAWVNARTFDGFSDGVSGFNDIMSCDFIGGTREWVLLTETDATLTDAKLSMRIFGTGGGEVSAWTPEIILANEWTHVAVTQDGSYTFGGYSMYINGKPQTLTNISSGTFTAPSVGTSNLGIGRRPGNSGIDVHWNGLIDDCAIWTRVLSPNQIMQLYLLGRGGMYERRRRTLRRVAIEQATGARRRRILTGMV